MKGRAKGKRIDKRGFGFHVWNLDAFERYDDLFDQTLTELIKEGLKLAAEEYKCEASFRAASEKHKNRKPTLIRVELPLGEEDFDGPAWEFDLAEIVEEAAWSFELSNGKLDVDARAPLLRIRKGLLQCIAQLDRSLTEIEETSDAEFRSDGEVQARSAAFGQQEGEESD